jgi:F-type H+-transporting ATPase subunit alpha
MNPSQSFTTAYSLVEELRKQIQGAALDEGPAEVGTVEEVGDGIVRLSGLGHVQSMEMLAFASGAVGVALNLEEDHVGAALFTGLAGVHQGETVHGTGHVLSVPVGDALVGRVVDPLGQPLDGDGPIASEAQYPVEKIAPGVMDRKSIHQPLMTGTKAIDALIPVGKGQRELIIGDRQTGKTTIAIDAILNQKGAGVKCVYVAVGQKASKVAKIVELLRAEGAMDYTTVVMATASDPASLQYIAPYAGCAMAEFFMERGEDALIVYDDLSKHAWAYREISLLLRRPPGREAYPGDVFYLHSRLLERAAKLSDEKGGGSLTALPIIETQAGDVSAYIPTNVISITDGQMFLESDLFYRGIRPALNVGLSVSRVGGAAQTKAMKKVAGQMRLDLAQFRELESFAQFATDVDAATKKQIDRGKRTVEVLKQVPGMPLPLERQVAVLYAVTRGYLDEVPVDKIRVWEEGFQAFLMKKHAAWLAALHDRKTLEENSEAELKRALEAWQVEFVEAA